MRLMDFFVLQCGMSAENANSISERLEKDHWISTLQALQENVEQNLAIFDDVGLPKTVQPMVKAKILSMNRKRLDTLSVNEVQILLKNVFPEDTQYGDNFEARKINGFVLRSVQNANTLTDWGIDSKIYADALLVHLSSWKEFGVPINLLVPKNEGGESTLFSQSSAQMQHTQASVSSGSSKENVKSPPHRSVSNVVANIAPAASAPSHSAATAGDAIAKKRGRPRKEQQQHTEEHEEDDEVEEEAVLKDKKVGGDGVDGGGGGGGKMDTSKGAVSHSPTLITQSNESAASTLASSLNNNNNSNSRASRELLALVGDDIQKPVSSFRTKVIDYSTAPPAAKKAHKAQKEGGADPAQAALSLNTEMKAHLKKLCSDRADSQIIALKYFSRQAADSK